jgi:hypothetical protein
MVLSSKEKLLNYRAVNHLKMVQGKTLVKRPLLESKVDIETFDFLKRHPEIEIKSLETEESAKNFKKMLLWASKELEKGKEVKLIAFSGEASPDFWNSIKEPLLDVINNGLFFTHFLGPVICMNGDEHTSIIARQTYAKRVSLFLFPTRYPFHWILFYSNKDDTICYRFYGELYHQPLAKKRKKFIITLDEREKNPMKVDKLVFFWSRIKRYECLKPFLIKVSNVNKLPKISKRELKQAYEKAINKEIDFNSLNSQDILRLAIKQ